MKVKYSLLLFLTTTVFPQKETNLLVLPQGFNLSQISIYGFSNTSHISPSNIAVGNPALLNTYDHMSVGISAQHETPINKAWNFGLGHERISGILPQTAGLIFPLGNFHLGFGYGQKYNSSIQFEPIPISSYEEPEGNGEYVNVIDQKYITSISVLFSWSIFNNAKFHHVALGGRINYNNLHIKQSILNERYKDILSTYSSAIGILYNYQIGEEKKLNIGLFYEQIMSFQKDGNFRIVESDGTTHINSVKILADVPQKLSIGTSLSLFHNTTIIGEASKILWSQAAGILDDQVETSITILFQPNELYKLSVGIYNSDYAFNRDLIYWSWNNADLESTYISMGFGVAINHFSIEISIADNRINSGKWRQNTLGNLSISYQWKT